MQGPPGVAGPRGAPVSINFTIILVQVCSIYPYSQCVLIWISTTFKIFCTLWSYKFLTCTLTYQIDLEFTDILVKAKKLY